MPAGTTISIYNEFSSPLPLISVLFPISTKAQVTDLMLVIPGTKLPITFVTQ